MQYTASGNLGVGRSVNRERISADHPLIHSFGQTLKKLRLNCHHSLVDPAWVKLRGHYHPLSPDLASLIPPPFSHPSLSSQHFLPPHVFFPPQTFYLSTFPSLSFCLSLLPFLFLPYGPISRVVNRRYLPLTICAAFSSEIFLSFLLTNFDK